uniref:Multiple epidermal growth factor-like domains protein 10 isoform X2 n=1 Tax=Crassostrea virginica TaxID=6565 RepID=A0A8B8C288_CRAVI|nr:multiple epidermal growth factor-like domains protein 10 isoform X2 [Crassostrea virginica]
MDVFLMFVFVCELSICFAYQTWQLHPYPNGHSWTSDKAVDGLKSDLTADGRQCTISGNYKTRAEWRVDLGGIFSVHNIFIYYRTEKAMQDKINVYAKRFLGFSVYISNTTQKEDGVLCFRDIYYTRATIPNPINFSCQYHGRYVIYYNNRTHPPFPNDYDEYAYNELCEVEVNGCVASGFYGESCSIPCPPNCQEGHCHITEGTCLGCIAGYSGNKCDKRCTENTYGFECSRKCGKCRNRSQCNHVTGTCPMGCDRGKYGDECVSDCPKYQYGYNCNENCSVNCDGSRQCDSESGHCKDGCKIGWKAPTCNTKCDENTYGQNCSNSCGFCLDGEQCHYIDGRCLNGCSSGYTGSQCTKRCSNNTYGPRCSLSCGNCLYVYGEQCHHVTGNCPCGCVQGFHGKNCTEVSSFLPVSTSEIALAVPLYSLGALLGASVIVVIILGIKMKKFKMNVHQKTNKVTVHEAMQFKRGANNDNSNPRVESFYEELQEMDDRSPHYDNVD